ncbi:MAG: M23 family metallopeptidase [Proteobacteria bacterium]|jgi:murein DD-endopeptidase MepM/ murein hydrolase activator NlpD|nr:M23 family metallopeptidase [Pseudomonadota bacterium]
MGKLKRTSYMLSIFILLSSCEGIQQKLSSFDFDLRNSSKEKKSLIEKKSDKNDSKNNLSKDTKVKTSSVSSDKLDEVIPNKKPKLEAATLKPVIIEVKKPVFIQPVVGNTLRPYEKGVNDGIDISAVSGSDVRAVSGGQIVAITKDTDQRSIIIIRHQGNLLTIYANITNILVEKGQFVASGQKIATVPNSKPSFLHFEVREGIESVDPEKYFRG